MCNHNICYKDSEKQTNIDIDPIYNILWDSFTSGDTKV